MELGHTLGPDCDRFGMLCQMVWRKVRLPENQVVTRPSTRFLQSLKRRSGALYFNVSACSRYAIMHASTRRSLLDVLGETAAQAPASARVPPKIRDPALAKARNVRRQDAHCREQCASLGCRRSIGRDVFRIPSFNGRPGFRHCRDKQHGGDATRDQCRVSRQDLDQ